MQCFFSMFHYCNIFNAGVCLGRGLTRECLIALIADIETRNYRQEFNSNHGLHPRSSTTDDIECFFSVL